jgi:hypothetical protein
MSIEENKKIVEPRSKADIDPGAASTIMPVLTGAWAARLVYTAAELGIADHLAQGPHGVDFLAAQTGAHTPSLARLLRALTYPPEIKMPACFRSPSVSA